MSRRRLQVSLERLSVTDSEISGLVYPSPTDPDTVKKEKMKKVQEKLLVEIGEILNELQNLTEDNKKEIGKLYKKVEYVYERVGTVTTDPDIVRIYKNAVVNCIWSFGGVVWKMNTMGVVHKFISRCFDKLGGADKVVIRLFVKYNSDLNEKNRLSMLQVLYALLQSKPPDFAKRLHDNGLSSLLIRLHDRCSKCRVQTMLILEKLIEYDSDNLIVKELKYYTRFDVNVEVRKTGTSVLANTDMKLRFFYDQAFDKSVGVRFRAFKAFVNRDIGQIKADKVCKALLWGLSFSEKKCSDFVKNELLRTWLRKCDNKLPVLLAKLDAYANMKLVLRIVDIMLTNDDIKDSLDTSFINDIKKSVVEKNYDVSIESMVAWLCVCKHGLEVPEAGEILNIVRLLHHAVLVESNLAVAEQRNEDVTPVICTTVALHIVSFVVFEEANRRELVKELRKILLDPLLDERPLVIQAVMSLHKADPIMYEDVMMSVFEEIFDPDNNPKLGKNQNSDKYQIVKLREQLCSVSLERLELTSRREEYVRDKKYLDVIPLTEKLKELVAQEAAIKTDLAKLENAKPGVITSVEQGLSKALVMINTHLDIVPDMNSFIKNIYDNYVQVFLKEPDVMTKVSVLKFLTKIALLDKSKLKVIACLLIRVLVDDNDPDLNSAAYMCVVDLLVFYDYKDFLLTEQEIENQQLHPYIEDYDGFLSQVLSSPTTYVMCTEPEMEVFLTSIVSSYKSTEHGLKYQGLLKMLIRGKLTDVSTISGLLSLWVNHDYVGTCVLRDLEHVLKLWDTFVWWDQPGHRQSLIKAFSSAILNMSTVENHEVLNKFVAYILTFININNEDCLTTVLTTLLEYIYEKPCNTNVLELIRVCSCFPVCSDNHASRIAEHLTRIVAKLNDYPQTSLIKELKTATVSFLKKLNKNFNILVVQVEDIASE